MAVAEVKKIQLVALNNYKDRILELLQDSKAVELIGETNQETLIQSLEYDIAQITFAIQLIEKYSKEEVPFIEKLRGNKIRLAKEEIQKAVEKFDYKSITDELTDIEAQLNEAKNTIAKNQQEIEILTPWEELQASPIEFKKTKMTGVALGFLRNEDFDSLKHKIREFEKQIEINIVSRNDKFVYLMVIFSESVGEKISKVFAECKFEITELPHEQELPSQIIKKLNEEKQEAEKLIIELEERIGTHVDKIRDLKITHDFLTWQKNQKEAEKYIENTKRTFIVRFWAQTQSIEPLEKELGKITSKVVMTELHKEEEEDIPVPLRNSSLFTPFESVTNIYGVPKNNEPDPTPLLAPFFVVYFGLALTDAAYGIILALGALIAIKVLKIPKENQKLFIVLIWGGIATFILGALFGGWFGVDINAMDGALGGLLRSVRVMDPLANPIAILLLTMVLGIFQVMVGLGIHAWWDIKMKRVKEAILDSGTWLYFLSSLILWILATVEVLPLSTKPIFQYMLYAGVLILILTQGRDKKNPVMKIVSGIISLYGLVGYFSDVLSYSRLLALGLSTAIIASVVNLVAFLFKDMMPWAALGWVVAVVILIGGHIFNLAINVLGAYIHSGRLQFVEFFPKFMEGGGRRFKPFSRDSKYVQLVD